MFYPESRIRVFLNGQPADMRKSYGGLYAWARQNFDTDPLAGHLYVFANRRANQIKVLHFDRSGWCLWGKRLEQRRFVRNGLDMRAKEIDCTALKLMLEGIEVGRQFKRYRLQAVESQQ